MNNTLKMIIVLTVVGLVSGAALVLMFNYTDPLIKSNQESETKAALFKIFPDAKNYKEVGEGEDMYFTMHDETGKVLGYAFIAEGNGYQGIIKLMAGIEPDLVTMKGIEVLESQETPGLGQEITTEKFESQFIGLKTSPSITYVKNKKPSKPNEIEAITGATISSRSVVSILNNEIEKLKGKIK